MTTFGQRRNDDPATLFDAGGEATYFSHGHTVSLQEQDRVRLFPRENTQVLAPVDQASLGVAPPTPLIYQTQMDLNLLSSENYNEFYAEPRGSVESGGLSNQVYGGLQTMDRQPSPPHTRTRTRKGSKKTTTKASSPEETTRQRGRPRLDTKDQTAAERRRTQIRLAQRAYRQRKETTISGLNKRVTSLEQTIQDMHKTFQEFQDEAIDAGLRDWSPALARSLHRSAVTFAELAKNGIHESDAEGDDIETMQPGEMVGGEASTDVLSSRDMKPQLSKHESDPSQQPRQPGADAGLGTESIWGYSPSYEHLIVAPDTQQNQLPNRIPEVGEEDVQMQNWEEPPNTNGDISPTNQNFHLYQVQFPDQSFRLSPPPPFEFIQSQSFFPISSSLSTNSLPLPKTYANTETSFARRLVRHSLESAIHILSSPSTTQEEINRFCRFTFCFSNRPRVLSVLKHMVSRTTHENLEVWKVPSYHHGGSGLHFPRVGIDATSPAPENWAEMGPVGPLFNYEPETDEFEGVERQQIVEELGIDGEWFDSNDVEQYLRTKGVYLDGQSSLVEITEPEDDTLVPELAGTATATANTSAASPSITHSSLGGPQSPLNDFVPTNAVIYGNEELFNTDALSYDDAVPDIDMERAFANYNGAAGGFSASEKATSCPPAEFDFNLFPQMSQVLNQTGRDPCQVPAPAEALQLQMEGTEQEGEPGEYFKLKRRRFVDVDKLIGNIVPQSVCLGRTPGFRRAVVDDALRKATTEGLGEMGEMGEMVMA